MMTWGPIEPVPEDVSSFAELDAPRRRHRSRRRPWREGLAGQTVVKNLEDVRSYRSFERTLIGSVYPRSVIELELVHRLASLLWRLRRASAIETSLFEISEFLFARRPDPSRDRGHPGTLPIVTRANGQGPLPMSRTIAQCFLRLSDLDSSLLDRLGSYEERLWRQAAQTMWTLEAMRRPPPAPTRPLRKPKLRFYWDAELSRRR